MKESDLIFGIMASLGKSTYSVFQLKQLIRIFGISDSNLRTSLSRMVKRGIINSKKDNRFAIYSFSKKGLLIKNNVAKSFSNLNWNAWDGSWRGIAFSIPEKNKEIRYRIRQKLKFYRYGLLYSGFWIRPHQKEDQILNMQPNPLFKEHCTVIRFFPEKPFTIEQVGNLWEIPKLKGLFKETFGFLEKQYHSIKTLDPIEAFKKKIIVGERVVNVLFKDPLLPIKYMPNDWVGEDLKKLFTIWDTKVTEKSLPFLWSVFKNKNK